MNFLRHQVSKKKRRFVTKDYDLDLSYITSRIIAMGFPSTDMEKYYRNSYKDVKRFLDEFHPKHYKIYNLCMERKYDHSLFDNRVKELNIKDHNAANFHLLWEFVTDAERWLNSDENNIIAVHCKAGKGRTGLVLSCLLIYYCKLSITEAISTFDSARTHNNAGVTIPSQLRYISYFDRMIKGEDPYFAISKQLSDPNIPGSIFFIDSIEIYNAHLEQINSLYFIVEHFNFDKKCPCTKQNSDSNSSNLNNLSNLNLSESSKSRSEPFVENTTLNTMNEEEIEDYRPPNFVSLKEQIPKIYYNYNTKKKKLLYTKSETGGEIIHTFNCGSEMRIAPCYDVKVTIKYKMKEFVSFWFHTGFVKFGELGLNKFEMDGPNKYFKDLHHTKITKDFRVVLKFKEYVEKELK